jgi:glycosyltransferase involved in cell wall biosynthesis
MNKLSTRNHKRALVIGPFSSPHFQTVISAVAKLGISATFIPSDSPTADDFSLISKSISHYKCRIPIVYKFFSRFILAYATLDKFFGLKWRSKFIKYFLYVCRPNIIHINEIQRAGYSVGRIENIAKIKKDKTILISSWGSDISLFGHVNSHTPDMRKILEISDVLMSERETELEVARKLGFVGIFESPMYTTIGMQYRYENLSPCSSRKVILIKGYQNFAGRALNALNAIERCKEDLKDFRVIVFSASDDTKLEVELMRERSGIEIICLEKMSKIEFIENFANARIYIGIGISDGLSTSMVEAMGAGTFPIQSENSAAIDFIEDGVNGFIVDPWDLQSLQKVISRALKEDHLVDEAQRINADIIEEKYNYEKNFLKLAEVYLR